METATTMVSKITASHAQTKEVLSIEKVKVFVFYTKKHQIGNIFANSEMEFNLRVDN